MYSKTTPQPKRLTAALRTLCTSSAECRQEGKIDPPENALFSHFVLSRINALRFLLRTEHSGQKTRQQTQRLLTEVHQELLQRGHVQASLVIAGLLADLQKADYALSRLVGALETLCAEGLTEERTDNLQPGMRLETLRKKILVARALREHVSDQKWNRIRLNFLKISAYLRQHGRPPVSTATGQVVQLSAP